MFWWLPAPLQGGVRAGNRHSTALKGVAHPRLDDTKLKIKHANSELANLTRKRDEAIAAGNAPDAIRFKDQLKSTREQLGYWTVTKLALEAKVIFCERNEPGAAKLRDEVQAAWEETGIVIAAIAKA